MKVRRFEWEGPSDTADEIRLWTLAVWPEVEGDV